jgi:hypothetical protein
MAAKKYGQTLRIQIFFGHLHLRIEGFCSAYFATNRTKSAPAVSASEPTSNKRYSRSNYGTMMLLPRALALHDHRAVVGCGNKSTSLSPLAINTALTDLLKNVVTLGTTKFACLLVTLTPRSCRVGHRANNAAGPARCAADHVTLLSVGSVCLLAVHASRERDCETSRQRGTQPNQSFSHLDP